METTIEWTATRLPDGTSLPGYTFNPVWGCTKISPACTNCYAATWANRYGVGWGPKAERRTFGEKHWNEPLKWNRQAEKSGIRRKVFCASMADVFEDHATWETERPKLWPLIEATPHLDWLLLTKRPENIMGMIPEAWRQGLPANVWAGTTAENQEWADKRVPHLLRVPAVVRFLSMEPLLGPVDLGLQSATCDCCDRWPSRWVNLERRVTPDYPMTTWPEHQNKVAPPGIYRAESNRHGALSVLTPGGRLGIKPDEFEALPGLDWIIAGGESGHGVRPSHPDWYRDLRDQCAAAGVPFHFKQWGEHVMFQRPEVPPQGCDYLWVSRITGATLPDCPQPRTAAVDADWEWMGRVGKKRAGRVLDGVTHDGFPAPVAGAAGPGGGA